MRVNQYEIMQHEGIIEINQEDPLEEGGNSVFLTIEQLPLFITQLQKIISLGNDKNAMV